MPFCFAWQSLSLAARRVIDRVVIEHMAHAGTMNGLLVVTYADFVKFGLRRMSLTAAIQEAAATGLLVITEKGRASTGPDRWPNKFALGWLPTHDGAAPLNRWKSWRKPQAQAPIPGNIESSSGSATRETRRNPRPLVAQTILAPGSGNDTGDLAETLNSAVAEALPGKMNLAGVV